MSEIEKHDLLKWKGDYFPFRRMYSYYCEETKNILWNNFGSTVYSLHPRWEILPEYIIVKNYKEYYLLIKVRFTNTVGFIFKKEKSVDVWIHEDDIDDEEIMYRASTTIEIIKCDGGENV